MGEGEGEGAGWEDVDCLAAWDFGVLFGLVGRIRFCFCSWEM